MTAIKAKAFAKLNLTLEVLGKRNDGFHEISSIMQTISLADHIEVTAARELSLECDLPSLNNNENLAMRAACLLRENQEIRDGAHIRISKEIPLAAGLGGGSSDAVVVLKLLRRLWAVELTDTDLLKMVAEIGSDLPFFVNGGTAIVQGKGERVRQIPNNKSTIFVVVVPELNMQDKTKGMYSKLELGDFTSGGLSRKLEARIRGGGDIPDQLLHNAFQEVLLRTVPSVRKSYEALQAVGREEIHLTGSGPALFSRVSSQDSGRAIQLLLQYRHGENSFVVESAPGNCSPE